MNTFSSITLLLALISANQPRTVDRRSVELAKLSKEEIYLNEFYFIRVESKSKGRILLTIAPAESAGRFLSQDSHPSGTVVATVAHNASATTMVTGKRRGPLRSSDRIPIALILKALPSQVKVNDGFYVIVNRSGSWGSTYFIDYCRRRPGHDAEITRWIDSKGRVTHER